MGLAEVKEGQVYQHIVKQTFYTVVSVANDNSNKPDMPVTVVYLDQDSRVWARPIDEFLTKFQLVRKLVNGDEKIA